MNNILKRPGFAIFWLAATLIFFASCKMQEEVLPIEMEASTLPANIEEIKRLYNSLPSELKKVGPPHTVMATKGGSGTETRKKQWDPIPYWEGYVTNDKVKGMPEILVPIIGTDIGNNSLRSDMDPRGYRFLTFQRNPNGGYWSTIYEIHPDTEYRERRLRELGVDSVGNDFSDFMIFVRTEDFTGYTLVYDLDGRFRIGYHSKDGRYDRGIIPEYKK